MTLVLSLFPGIGLLDMAFEEEGFTIVRGPDILWGGDVRRFHPPAGRFDGVIGGPPCQAFSPLQRLVRHNREKARAAGDTRAYREAENLIPEFERCVSEAAPAWFLMENVPSAPAPNVAGYRVWSTLVQNRTLPREDGSNVGADQSRERRWSFGTRDGRSLGVELAALMSPRYTPAVTASGSTWQPVRIGGSMKPKRRGRVAGLKTKAYLAAAIEAQGLPPEFLQYAPFTVSGAIRAVGNGVPLAMGRAIARAVKAALATTTTEPREVTA